MKALDIANYIVDYANLHYPEEKLTHVKLQKILYYAYASMLKKTNKQLFDESIEKWQYGPVVRSVYDIFRSYGYSKIEQPYTSMSMQVDENGAVQFIHQKFDRSLIESDQVTTTILNQVIDKLISYDAFRLVDMTHEEDSWKLLESQIKSREYPLFYSKDDFLKHAKDII